MRSGWFPESFVGEVESYWKGVLLKKKNVVNAVKKWMKITKIYTHIHKDAYIHLFVQIIMFMYMVCDYL